MVRGIREAFRPGTEPKVADIGDDVTGPQPYDKVFQNGVTGAPNAASAVNPQAPPPPPKKKEDVTGLY
jgi:penicillin-binding protein 1A